MTHAICFFILTDTVVAPGGSVDGLLCKCNMDPVVLRQLSKNVQSHLQSAVDKCFPENQWFAPVPWCFGSQLYSLASPSSDVDLLVLAPQAIVEQGDDIRAIMAHTLCAQHVRQIRVAQPQQGRRGGVRAGGEREQAQPARQRPAPPDRPAS